ncbi:peptide/nickel transport system permease protein [Solirubrobacter pauli]|uniref:Peptide/nickel transport system permease protein n=1 Tax=Solirubrobacter pauli TaxID=166793 RepID=A0A660KY27_9ACTN|nr:ABC transporter permease subunit [Solirubrobacter pauli]RKQ86566.1 peptide/nickel transport system permease protein [Solirubrobacter pauli]
MRGVLVIVASFALLALLGPELAPYAPDHTDLDAVLEGPSAAHLLGTDDLGRDTLSRLLHAARTSLTAVALVLAGALGFGVLVGSIAALRGGIVDEVLMRITDVALAIPNLVTALAILGFLGPGVTNMVLALMLAAWPAYARLSRTLIVSVHRRPYIEAVQLMGARRSWILRKHLIPAALGPVLVYATADAGFIVVSVATLSFLGLGVQPPTPEWGQMLVAGLPFMETSPGLVIFPGLALTLLVIGFNLAGERVALDRVPRPLSRRRLVRRRAEALA